MKNHRFLLPVLLLLPHLCFSQTRPTASDVPVAAPPGVVTSQVALSENLTIGVAGSYGDNLPIALSITGIGPNFSLTTPDTTVTFQATATQHQDKVELTYNLTAELPVKPAPNTIEYRNATIAGSCLMEYDKPLTIATFGQKKIVIEITKRVPE